MFKWLPSHLRCVALPRFALPRLAVRAFLCPSSPEATAYAAGALPVVWQQTSAWGVGLAPSLLERNTEAVEEAARREADWGAAGLEDGGAVKARKAAELRAAAKKAFADAGGAAATSTTLQDLLSCASAVPPSVACVAWLPSRAFYIILPCFSPTSAVSGGNRDKRSAFSHQTEFGQEQAAPEVVAGAMEASSEDADKKSEAQRKEEELAALQAELAQLSATVAHMKHQVL